MTKPISTRKFTTTSSHWQRTEEPAALGPQWRILCMVLSHAPIANLALSGLPLQPGASPPGGPAAAGGQSASAESPTHWAPRLGCHLRPGVSRKSGPESACFFSNKPPRPAGSDSDQDCRRVGQKPPANISSLKFLQLPNASQPGPFALLSLEHRWEPPGVAPHRRRDTATAKLSSLARSRTSLQTLLAADTARAIMVHREAQCPRGC